MAGDGAGRAAPIPAEKALKITEDAMSAADDVQKAQVSGSLTETRACVLEPATG